MKRRPIQGRIIAIEPQTVHILNQSGIHKLTLEVPSHIHLGDLVETHTSSLKLLTPNRTPHKTTHWAERTLHPRRLKAMHVRQKVESGIREFFLSKNFLETRTPLLVPCPGMEPHIRPWHAHSTQNPVQHFYLPTSPEFAMKRLLVGGLERIFQISHAFRDEPNSSTHRPEFAMLEWYRAYAGYEDIMKDTEELFEHLALKIFGEPAIPFQGSKISVKTPWPRLKIRDLFLEKVGIDLTLKATSAELAKECQRLGIPADANEPWDDLYFKIWLNCIEPKLPQDQAVFVTRYPASQAALSVIDADPDGSPWARRFELYLGGLELGNAFEELTDPVEQRKRFIKDMALRKELYGPEFPENPLDEEFLDALTEGMPPSGGIAVGVDRMVMLYANEPQIDYTGWL